MKEREHFWHGLCGCAVAICINEVVCILRVATNDNHSYVYRVSGSLEHFPKWNTSWYCRSVVSFAEDLHYHHHS